MVPRVIRMLIKAFRVNLKKILQPPPLKKNPHVLGFFIYFDLEKESITSHFAVDSTAIFFLQKEKEHNLEKVFLNSDCKLYDWKFGQLYVKILIIKEKFPKLPPEKILSFINDQ